MKLFFPAALAIALLTNFCAPLTVLGADPSSGTGQEKIAASQPVYSMEQGLRVFLAAHSFCIPTGSVVVEIAHAAGLKNHVLAGEQFLGGSSVTQQWDRPDAENKAKQALMGGQIDVLELSPNRLMPDPAINSFVELGLKYNPALRVTIQESWGPYSLNKAETGNPPTAESEAMTFEVLMKLHAAYYTALETEVRSINESYKRQIVFCVPSGPALFALREKVRLGQAPGIKTQAELYRDRLGHPTPPALLLNAYCHYAVIYQRSPVGLPVPSLLANTSLTTEEKEKLNRLLQELAWAAVLANPLSGIKDSSPAPHV
jgi:hypothetical protein